MKAILFLHPGREYSATVNSIKEWTRGDHTRNFIKMAGAKFVDAGGKLQAGDIGFWGEWEAHATIEKDAAGHSVFSPYLDLGELPAHGESTCGTCCASDAPLDTDPFVFGDCFLYANCLQPSYPALRGLEPGSLILFATTRGGTHFLDTVFVVGDKIPAWPTKFDGEVREKLGEDFQVYSKVSLSLSRNGDDGRTLYRGATFQSFDEMFSFVPASAGAVWREKFVLDNSLLEGVPTLGKIAPGEIFENGQNQGIAIIAEGAPSVKRLWENIRDGLLRRNFVLAARVPMPQIKVK